MESMVRVTVLSRLKASDRSTNGSDPQYKTWEGETKKKSNKANVTNVHSDRVYSLTGHIQDLSWG